MCHKEYEIANDMATDQFFEPLAGISLVALENEQRRAKTVYEEEKRKRIESAIDLFQKTVSGNIHK